MQNSKFNHTDSAKRAIGQTTKERWKDPEYKARVAQAISKGKTGVKFSKKHKANLKSHHSGFTGKVMSEEQKIKISQTLQGHPGHAMKVNKVRHHVYLRQHSDEIILLTVSKHNSLHRRAYDYIYATQGEAGIDKYLEWFDLEFGLS
jgi:hypothetical protein